MKFITISVCKHFIIKPIVVLTIFLMKINGVTGLNHALEVALLA